MGEGGETEVSERQRRVGREGYEREGCWSGRAGRTEVTVTWTTATDHCFDVTPH